MEIDNDSELILNKTINDLIRTATARHLSRLKIVTSGFEKLENNQLSEKTKLSIAGILLSATERSQRYTTIAMLDKGLEIDAFISIQGACASVLRSESNSDGK
jgi:hypothetical protein